jgi:YHS domain-containing protein
MQQGKAINTTCPVMGTTISGDTPYRVEYKGKEVGFCCAQCVAAFNANPEKYASKIKDAAENK